MSGDPPPPITLVLLAEAHVAVPVSLRHTGVVHHEEVHLEVVSAGSLNLVVLCSYELNHLHTAPITWHGGRHVSLRIGPVPRVVTAWVIPRVTGETVNTIARHTVTPCLVGVRHHPYQHKTCDDILPHHHHTNINL